MMSQSKPLAAAKWKIQTWDGEPRKARMPEVPRATAKPQRKALGPTSMSSSLADRAQLARPCTLHPLRPPEKPPTPTPLHRYEELEGRRTWAERCFPPNVSL